MTLSFPVFFFCSLVIIGGRAGRLRPYSPAIFGVLGIYFLGSSLGAELVASRRLPRPVNPQTGRRAGPTSSPATPSAESRSSLALGARQKVSLIVVLNN